MGQSKASIAGQMQRRLSEKCHNTHISTFSLELKLNRTIICSWFVSFPEQVEFPSERTQYQLLLAILCIR